MYEIVAVVRSELPIGNIPFILLSLRTLRSMGEFSQIAPDNQSGVSQNGISWWRNATSRNVDMGYASYRDATHRMGLIIPQDCYKNGTLDLKFNTTTNGGFNLVSGGVDNIKITGYNIPPNKTEPPTMAPTMDLKLDICVADVMYDRDIGSVHRHCFDMAAKMSDAAQGTPEEHVVGEACVEAIDNNNFQFQVKPRGPEWTFSKASAWTGESVDNAPRMNNSDSLDVDAFQTTRRWGNNDGIHWVATLPLVPQEHCAADVDEFTEMLILYVEGQGPDPVTENNTVTFKATGDGHYDSDGDFHWAHLVFSCHCNHDAHVDPPPTGTPSEAPSLTRGGLQPSNPDTPSPTIVPTSSTSTVGIEACVATDDGSGRQCRPLVGKDGTHFGEVCIEMAFDGDTGENSNHVLNVTYATREDYRLTRNFLWLGDHTGAKVPTKSRESQEIDIGEEPDVEHFPHFSW